MRGFSDNLDNSCTSVKRRKSFQFPPLPFPGNCSYDKIKAEHFLFSSSGRRQIMPYVNIKITKEGNVTKEQKAALIKGATDLLVNVLHKNPASTVVVIDEVDLDNWGLGGDPHSRRKRKEQEEIK